MRVDAIGGTSGSPEVISVVNSSKEEQDVNLTGSGDYVGVFTGKELSLQEDTALRIAGRDAKLFVRTTVGRAVAGKQR